MGLPSSQNPLVRPSVGPGGSVSSSTELLQGVGEIVAEDTNNISVKVLNTIILHSLNNFFVIFLL